MSCALIVSTSEKGKSFFADLIKTVGISNIVTVGNGSEARRILNRTEFDLVVINAPLSDEFGHELSISISKNYNAGVLLVVKNDIADAISSKVEYYGVFVIEKPLNRQFVYKSIKYICISRKKYLGLQSENERLKVKISEIRLIDRAKCILIEYLNMSEPQAHRYIEKQAMDLRVTKKEIAENILKTYEM